MTCRLRDVFYSLVGIAMRDERDERAHVARPSTREWSTEDERDDAQINIYTAVRTDV